MKKENYRCHEIAPVVEGVDISAIIPHGVVLQKEEIQNGKIFFLEKKGIASSMVEIIIDKSTIELKSNRFQLRYKISDKKIIPKRDLIYQKLWKAPNEYMELSIITISNKKLLDIVIKSQYKAIHKCFENTGLPDALIEQVIFRSFDFWCKGTSTSAEVIGEFKRHIRLKEVEPPIREIFSKFL